MSGCPDLSYSTNDLVFRNICVAEDEDDTNDGVLAKRFTIGFDFAVTRGFAIAAEETVGLKWLMFNKHNKRFHSSRRKNSLGWHVGKLAFRVDVLHLDFGIQIGLVQKPIKSNSAGSRKMSRCRASSLDNHLDHCFVFIKTHTTKLLDAKIGRFEGTQSIFFKTLIIP